MAFLHTILAISVFMNVWELL